RRAPAVPHRLPEGTRAASGDPGRGGGRGRHRAGRALCRDRQPPGRFINSYERPGLAMFRPLLPALSLFLAATAGRNMTRPAYVAVAVGVMLMVLSTLDPAYQAAHHWV